MAWIAVAIPALAIVLFSVPSSFEHYRTVCTAASEICSERTVRQPTPEGVRALRDIGLSLGSYALLNVVIDKIFQLAWFAVGLLIFWRRSDDRMALLVSAFLASFGTVTVEGALWGAWHLPTFFVPGTPQHGLPFSVFVLLTMAYSVVIGWVYVQARGSVLIASLLHGAINFSQGFFLGGVHPAKEYWLLAAVYSSAALAVALVFGTNLSRKH